LKPGRKVLRRRDRVSEKVTTWRSESWGEIMEQSCREFELALEQYLDGEITGEAAVRFQEHLRRCPACRDEVEAEQLLRASFAALPVISCPDAVVHGIRDVTLSASAHSVQVRRWFPLTGRRRWALAPAVAAAAAVVVLALVAMPRLRRHEPAPPYSRLEIARARQEAVWCLAFSARVIDLSSREAVSEVFGRQVPQAITSSLRKVMQATEGGRR
jgi:anti-sigma factor RsiW